MTQAELGRITLPSGLWQEERHQREAELRALSGVDELFVLHAPADWPAANRVTMLLARCVTRIGSIAPVMPATMAMLTVGDREALLLELRRLSYGNLMDCLLNCAHCETRLDLGLEAEGLRLPPYVAPAPAYERTLGTDLGSYCVRFRLPTGADQEVIATMAAQGEGAALRELIRRCVADVVLDGTTLADTPEALAELLSAAMAECDPQAELTIRMECPECGGSFSAIFDTGHYLWEEAARRGQTIFDDVHMLALYYHWREADILQLSTARRRMYLDLLDQSIGERMGL